MGWDISSSEYKNYHREGGAFIRSERFYSLARLEETFERFPDESSRNSIVFFAYALLPTAILRRNSLIYFLGLVIQLCMGHIRYIQNVGWKAEARSMGRILCVQLLLDLPSARSFPFRGGKRLIMLNGAYMLATVGVRSSFVLSFT